MFLRIDQTELVLLLDADQILHQLEVGLVVLAIGDTNEALEGDTLFYHPLHLLSRVTAVEKGLFLRLALQLSFLLFC